jgi:outer membrane receptor protein involved in Fe transport
MAATPGRIGAAPCQVCWSLYRNPSIIINNFWLILNPAFLSMKIKSLLFSLLLCCAITTLAQQQGLFIVKGTLIDSADKKPVQFMTVRLLNDVKKPIKGVLSGSEGTFNIEHLTNGKYTLEFTAVGYKVKAISIELKTGLPEVYYTGNIYVSPSLQQLKGVTVAAKKPIVRLEIDRIVYDVQADPESAGSNMLDMMYKIPLLSVEGDDNIKLKGSSDFKIYINGRPSNMVARNPALALRIMKATNVLRVEVITTPSAKYDAEGLSGIINIVTKSIPAGYNIILEAFDNIRSYDGVGASFTFKEGKMGFNGYVGKWGKNFGRNLFFNAISPVGQAQTNIEQSGNSQITGPNTPANIDYSFEIDSINLLTASLSATFDHASQDGSQFANSFDSNHQIIQSFNLSNLNTTERDGLDFGVNYQHGFRANKEKLLTVSYNYTKSATDFSGNNTTLSSLNYSTQLLKQQNKNGYTYNTVQVDFVSPIKKGNVEAGAKAILRDNYSDIYTETYNATTPVVLSNVFNYRQNVYSAYNSYQFKWENWGFKAGARLELTTINTGQTGNNYLNLIPSVAVQHKFKNANSLNFGYTRRVARPNLVQLNSFENRTNPLFYSSGNPNLVPVTSHNFDFNYTSIRKAVTNFSINYAVADKTIQTVVIQGTDGITRSTLANIGKYANLGANLNINYPLTKKLNFVLNGRMQYLWLQALFNNQGYQNQGLSGDATGNLIYRFKNDWLYTVRFSAYSNSVNLQGQTHAYYSAYTRLTKEFFNHKLGLIASVNNPFAKYSTVVTDYNTNNAVQRYIVKNDIRAVYINVYYTFGHLKEKIKKNKRNINNDDLDKGKTTDN